MDDPDDLTNVSGTARPRAPSGGDGSFTTGDLLAGRVHLMFDNLASALPNIQAGKLRALAVTTGRRSSFLPELPTLDESGLKGFDMTTWWGLMAPAKTPPPVVDRIALEARRAIETPELRERWRAMGDVARVRVVGRYDPTPGRSLLAMLEQGARRTVPLAAPEHA